jgi:hypothetical protein
LFRPAIFLLLSIAVNGSAGDPAQISHFEELK